MQSQATHPDRGERVRQHKKLYESCECISWATHDALRRGFGLVNAGVLWKLQIQYLEEAFEMIWNHLVATNKVNSVVHAPRRKDNWNLRPKKGLQHATTKTFNSREFAAPGCTCYFHLHRSCWSCCDYHLTHHLRVFIPYTGCKDWKGRLTSAGTVEHVTDLDLMPNHSKNYCDHIIISYHDECCVYLMMAWIHGFPEWVARHGDSHAHFVEQHSFTKHQKRNKEKNAGSCRTSLISRSWNIVNPCKSKHSLLVW